MDEQRHRRIELRAYKLWEEADRPDGRELEFWLQAEQEVGNLGGVNEADPYLTPDDLDQGEFHRREQIVEQRASQTGVAPVRRSAEQADPSSEPAGGSS